MGLGTTFQKARSRVGRAARKVRRATGAELVTSVLQEGAYQAGVGGVSPLEEHKKRKSAREASETKRATAAARARIKPIPDPEAEKAARRKTAGRRRAKRGGRASTILSGSEDTLG